MNFSKYQQDTGRFLKWKNFTSRDEALRFRFLGDPDVREEDGKKQYEFKVEPVGSKEAKVLTLSQLALNTLIAAANKVGIANAMESVVWTAWREGEGYDTKYRFEPGRPVAAAQAAQTRLDDDVPF